MRFVTRIFRKFFLVLLRLPETQVYLPVLKNCPYDGELKHKCENCLTSMDIPFCVYDKLFSELKYY